MHPEPHSVLPIHCRTSTRNRHRRSTWAGVSWPNDDGIGVSGGDNIDRTLARSVNTQIGAQCDEPLRAFVRALARQAARELFEASVKRQSKESH
jgi:hypothetical protein